MKDARYNYFLNALCK